MTVDSSDDHKKSSTDDEKVDGVRKQETLRHQHHTKAHDLDVGDDVAVYRRNW